MSSLPMRRFAPRDMRDGARANYRYVGTAAAELAALMSQT